MHVTPGDGPHGSRHRVGDVVELEIEKDALAPLLQFVEQAGPGLGEQDGADFEEGGLVP